MKTLCIIPCGSSKIWDKYPGAGPTKAKEVYTGSFHKKCREYAQLFHTHWVILSAKYGYLFPNDIVPGNYNVTFNKKDTCPVDICFLRQQVRGKGLDRFERIIVLAGKNYEVIIVKSFSDDREFLYPLRGCKGMGYMMQRMDRAIKDKTPLF